MEKEAQDQDRLSSTEVPVEQRYESWVAVQEAMTSLMSRLMELVDSETLDQWEREQYNRLKLEQEVRDDQ